MTGLSSNQASLNPQSFQAIADLAYNECGLQLVAEKTSMIQSRLRHRLKAVGAETFDAYAAYVCSDAGIKERIEMISALTTNVSHFFREKHHFDILRTEVLPAAMKTLRSGGRFRIWSAGCSNGQEPYSIAITAQELMPEIAKLDFKILATDIDPKVVEFARAGKYPHRLVGGVPESLLKKYFASTESADETVHQVTPTLQSCIAFRELNLLSRWPMTGQIDLIFCRNVVIYFDAETQNSLWPRFKQILATNGRLFLGHSERISDPPSAGFRNVGPTAYQRVSAQPVLPARGASDVT